MADKKKTHTPKRVAAAATAQAEVHAPSTAELDQAFEKGQVELAAKGPEIEQLITKDRLEKFIFGDLTWAQLMGMTMEQAYDVAEYGYGLYEESRYHDAKTVFEALVLANPYDAYFHNMLGATYQQLDMKDEALEQYTLAIELDPEAMHAYVNRGELLLQNGQFESALKDLDLAIKLDKSGSDPAVVRARALAGAAGTVMDGVKKLFGKEVGSLSKPKR